MSEHEKWKPFLASDGINQGMPFMVYPDEIVRLIAEYDALKARVAELERIASAAKAFVEYDGESDVPDYVQYGPLLEALKEALR